jgi:serine/threonine-protein kinase
MGDVYRADDLRLGQTVALKFLPEAFAQDPGRLQRFLGEVRIARQVTHPNVCRVYDVGETDGQHYLSMEYVDGEDLGSLLRRIGRLPEDKAVQLARQICAGLAAAHDQGILHRDLKPANVMIDGRGRARLTDFGLAGLAEGFAGGEVRAGTPAYMAPEQLAGKSVSIKSDLYSLGLVLYELFTGKQAFSAGSTAELMQLQQETSPPSPASHVSGLDPAVERVILRCLEREPTARPASALAVAAALPGGDPLAAALAAGETPSPEMVAAAGPEGGLKPAIAMLCLASVLAGVAAVAALYEKTSLLAPIPMQKPMAALQENAREIIRKLGYPEAPADSDSQFSFNFGRFQKLVRQSVSIPEHLSSPGQLLFEFQYRQSPSDLAPMNFTGGVQPNDPPASEGDINVELDLRGRLRSLRVKPAPVEFSQEPAPAPDWSVLFETAGLDMAAFEETTPTFQPRFFADTRAAWTGALIEPVETPVRIEAAALRGKPVAFERILPSDASWSAESMADEKAKDAARSDITNAIMLTLLIALLAGAVFLALRNSRLGRGDRRGALRMAGFVFAMRLVNWLIAGHHVAGDDDVILSVVALSGALFLGALTWVLYMALEPYVRRLWPESMVGWSRLLAGRFRDPLVGRDVLVGMTLGVALQVSSVAEDDLPGHAPRRSLHPERAVHDAPHERRGAAGFPAAVPVLPSDLQAPVARGDRVRAAVRRARIHERLADHRGTAGGNRSGAVRGRVQCAQRVHHHDAAREVRNPGDRLRDPGRRDLRRVSLDPRLLEAVRRRNGVRGAGDRRILALRLQDLPRGTLPVPRQDPPGTLRVRVRRGLEGPPRGPRYAVIRASASPCAAARQSEAEPRAGDERHRRRAPSSSVMSHSEEPPFSRQ